MRQPILARGEGGSLRGELTPAPSTPSGLGFGGALAWQLLGDMPSAGCGCGCDGAGQRPSEEERPVSWSARSPTGGGAASGTMPSRISQGSSISVPPLLRRDERISVRPEVSGSSSSTVRPEISGAEISGAEISGAEISGAEISGAEMLAMPRLRPAVLPPLSSAVSTAVGS